MDGYAARATATPGRLAVVGESAAGSPYLDQIAITAQADGLALIPAGAGELPVGTEVAYLPLQRF